LKTIRFANHLCDDTKRIDILENALIVQPRLETPNSRYFIDTMMATVWPGQITGWADEQAGHVGHGAIIGNMSSEQTKMYARAFLKRRKFWYDQASNPSFNLFFNFGFFLGKGMGISR
jgi:hypothetical protein